MYIRAGYEDDKRNTRSHGHEAVSSGDAFNDRVCTASAGAGPDIRFIFRGRLFSTGLWVMGNVCMYLNDVYEDYEATYSRRHYKHSPQTRLKYVFRNNNNNNM